MSETSGTKYLEDQILLKLLATAKGDDAVPALIDYSYKEVCINLLEASGRDFRIDLLDAVSGDAFVEFWDQIKYEVIKLPLRGGLFYYYLEVLIQVLNSKENLSIDAEIMHLDKPIAKYLESEILVYLLYLKHRRTENTLYSEFKRPMINILKKRYPSLLKEPDGIYNEALADGIDYIRKGKLKPPLKARLLTFLTRFARNKLVNWFKKRKQMNEILSEEIDQFDSWLKKHDDSRNASYSEFLGEKYDKIGNLWPANDEDLVAKILNIVDPSIGKYLKLRFLDELPYKEIVEKLKKEGINTNENALRARIFSALKRVREDLK